MTTLSLSLTSSTVAPATGASPVISAWTSPSTNAAMRVNTLPDSTATNCWESPAGAMTVPVIVIVDWLKLGMSPSPHPASARAKTRTQRVARTTFFAIIEGSPAGGARRSDSIWR